MSDQSGPLSAVPPKVVACTLVGAVSFNAVNGKSKA
jgi:hypothetical protein